MHQPKANNWDYSFDDFDNFRDLSHLTHLVVGKVESQIQGARAYFFIHNLSLREYRQEDKEGSFSISEDNPLITYLALQNRILDRKNLGEDPLLKNDEINTFLIIEQLSINTIVPFVYRYQLLGFLGLRFEDGQEKLEKEERTFLKKMQQDLLQNLYAALLIDRRFSELVVLSELGKEISGIQELSELYAVVFNKISQIVTFSTGILWIAREDKEDSSETTLEIKSSIGLPREYMQDTLTAGNSISGYVFQAGKALLIKELDKHTFFQDRNEEPYLKNAIIAMPLRASDQCIGVLTLHNNSGTEFTGETLHLISIFTNFTAATISNIRLYKKLEKGYFDTISALVAALDAKDPYSAGHSERVMQYAVGISEELKLPLDKIRLIRFAAILHDIGKIGIKGDIIRKRSRLTDDEYTVIKKHPRIGHQIISAIDFLQEAKTFIMYHHERYDGTGYYQKPFKEIPLEAMVLNVADSFDAMTTDRPYRKGFSYKEALLRMSEDLGKQFAPDCFRALIRYLKSSEMIEYSFSIPDFDENFRDDAF